jgi:hypothetical protein
MIDKRDDLQQPLLPFNHPSVQKTVPRFLEGFLFVADRLAGLSLTEQRTVTMGRSLKHQGTTLKRKFSPGLFVLLLRSAMRESFYLTPSGAINYLEKERRCTFTVAPKTLVDWASHLFHYRIADPKIRRKKVKTYLRLLACIHMDLIQIQFDKAWTITFPEDDWVRWQADHFEASVRKELTEEQIRRYSILNNHVNNQELGNFFPHHLKLLHLPDGKLNPTDPMLRIKHPLPDDAEETEDDIRRFEKKRLVGAKRQATYSREITNEHFRAILGGACEYHPLSGKPRAKRSLRTAAQVVDKYERERNILSYRVPRDIEEDKARVKAEYQERLANLQPTRDTWAVSNATAAGMMGHSLATQKRRMAHGHIVNTISQHLKLGEVSGDNVPGLRDHLNEIGYPCRFVPLRDKSGNPTGKFEVQRDRPSRFAYKKGHKNWTIDQVPPCLWTNREGALPRKPNSKEGTRQAVVVTEHERDWNNYDATRVLLRPNVVTLEHLPEQLDNEAEQELLRDLGLRRHSQSKWVRRARNARRGSHQKAIRTRPGTRLKATVDLGRGEVNKVNWRTAQRHRSYTYEPQAQQDADLIQSLQSGGGYDIFDEGLAKARAKERKRLAESQAAFDKMWDELQEERSQVNYNKGVGGT